MKSAKFLRASRFHIYHWFLNMVLTVFSSLLAVWLARISEPYSSEQACSVRCGNFHYTLVQGSGCRDMVLYHTSEAANIQVPALSLQTTVYQGLWAQINDCHPKLRHHSTLNCTDTCHYRKKCTLPYTTVTKDNTMEKVGILCSPSLVQATVFSSMKSTWKLTTAKALVIESQQEVKI